MIWRTPRYTRTDTLVPHTTLFLSYRRQVMTCKNILDRTLGVETVRVDRVVPDPSEFELRYEPNHPAADDQGYVKLPNVNTLIELSDMREAQDRKSTRLNSSH